MHPKKLNNILLLPLGERFYYSIREIVKLEKVWAVGSRESWATIVDVDGVEIFPIWPHKEVAEFCMFSEFEEKGYLIDEIGLQDFISLCIPDMIKKGVMFGVFYDKGREALITDGAALEEELNDEVEGDSF